MEPNAALQEPPAELSMPTVLLRVWQSCGWEMYNWEHASIHKLHHWCGDVHTTHQIHRNTTELRILFFLSKVAYHTLSLNLNPSSNIQYVYWNCMDKTVLLTTHTDKQACAHTNTNTETL